MTEENEVECRTPIDYMLYKLDRTLAVAGVIMIALCALWWVSANEALQIATAAVGGLIGYIGGRAGK